MSESKFNLRPRVGVENLRVYEPGRPLEEVGREFGLIPEKLVKLASNENSLGPSRKAIMAMQLAATTMHLYPDGGVFYLRKVLSDQLNIEPEMLLFGNGSNEIIELLGHVFMQPGTNIVMSECAFIVYKLVADAMGAEARMAPMTNFVHDLDAMLGLVDEDTCLFFVANPNNPTGTVVDPDELLSLADRLPSHVLLVLDEAYVELLAESDQPDTLRLVQEERPVVILRTFSKTYGLAGLRIGYAIADPEIVNLLNKYRQPFNVNAMAQAGALAALTDPGYVEATRELVADGLEQWQTGCEALGLETVPSVANFLLVKVGKGREVFERMQRRGIIVRPMDGYGLPDYVRVTVGTCDENEQALEVLGKLMRGEDQDDEV